VDDADTGAFIGVATRSLDGYGAALGAAYWLSLAAAPTFAIMALLTAILGGGRSDAICAAEQHASALGGMVPMYLLMSAFHAAPWLRLVASRWRGPAGFDSTPPSRTV
jgi:hypothetical protein